MKKSKRNKQQETAPVSWTIPELRSNQNATPVQAVEALLHTTLDMGFRVPVGPTVVGAPGDDALEERLARRIFLIMGGTFYKWQSEPDDDPDEVVYLLCAAYPVAKAIAKKLAMAIPGERNLNAQRWMELVDKSAADAFVEAPGGTLVRIGQNRSFLADMASYTAVLVAPSGSEWERAAQTDQERLCRKQLLSLGLPRCAVDRMMREYGTASKQQNTER